MTDIDSAVGKAFQKVIGFDPERRRGLFATKSKIRSEVNELRASGLGLDEIARRCGIHSKTVWNYLRDAGVKKGTRKR